MKKHKYIQPLSSYYTYESEGTLLGTSTEPYTYTITRDMESEGAFEVETKLFEWKKSIWEQEHEAD